MKKKNYKMCYFDRRIDSCQNYFVSFKNIKHFNKAKKNDNNKPKRITVIQFKLNKKKQLSKVNGCF